MNDRAFFIKPIKGRFGKLKGYIISDGYNEITLGLFDVFLIDTDEPLTKRIIRKG